MGITDIKSLFFDNKSLKQTIFKNAFWLTVAEVINKLLKLVLIIYVARILGATEYGKFAFALAFIGLFGIFLHLGLPRIIIREFASDKEKEKEYPALFSLKILLSLGTLVLILIGSFFVTPDSLIRKLIWILAIYTVVDSFFSIIYVFFKARQRMEYESWVKILQAIFVTAFGLFVIFNFPSVESLSYAYLFAAIIALVITLLFFHFKVYRLSLDWNKSIWKRFLTMSWPLALSGVFLTIFSNTDSVMMGYLGQITQTGWYNAASRIIVVAILPSSFIAQSFFPALSSSLNDPKKLQKIWNHQMEIMIFLALPIMVGGMVLAPRIIDFIYGADFAPSVLAFQILILSVGFILLQGPLGQVIVIFNQQKKTFWIIMMAAVFNVILNLILIPKYSLYGAAFSSVISYSLVLFLMLRYIVKLTPIKPFSSPFVFGFLGTIFSAILMYFVISQSQVYALNIYFSIPIGASAYIAAFLLFKKSSKFTKIYWKIQRQ